MIMHNSDVSDEIQWSRQKNKKQKTNQNELDSIGGRPPISRQLFLAQMDQF